MMLKDQEVEQHERFIKAQHVSIKMRERRAQIVIGEFECLEIKYKRVIVERNSHQSNLLKNDKELEGYR